MLDMVRGTLRTWRATSPPNSRASNGLPTERRRPTGHSHSRKRNRDKLRANGGSHSHAKRQLRVRVTSVAR
eukprot:1984846-Pleurochrysis_carterae.AAC.1